MSMMRRHTGAAPQSDASVRVRSRGKNVLMAFRRLKSCPPQKDAAVPVLGAAIVFAVLSAKSLTSAALTTAGRILDRARRAAALEQR